jgi:hypothetical protein
MDGISPVSTLQTPVSRMGTPASMQTPTEQGVVGEKHVYISPAEKNSYFPDDKIVMPVATGLEVDDGTRQPPSATGNSSLQPPGYQTLVAELPDRPKKPFWKRHLVWLLLAVILILILAIILGKLFSHHSNDSKDRKLSAIIPNNTQNSVASTGLFLQDGTTWNTHVFWQNSTGGITMQMSLDGSKSYAASRKVSLTIPPKVGSPLSATAEQDEETGVVMVGYTPVYLTPCLHF